jgi:hypothetical protein
MECGFYHPSMGYWQTNSKPSADTVAAYPEGTVEVPLKPHANCEWDGSTWVDVPPPPPTAEQRISELKQFLRDTDYVVLSDYDKDKPDVLLQRQAWRDEIRELEA